MSLMFVPYFQGRKSRLTNVAQCLILVLGCVLGPHVFYEKTPKELHHQHPFSLSSHPPSMLAEDAVLDVTAIDCEMIYTTGGMCVAHVSVVDGDGKEVFNEFVHMDKGVKVIDYIMRCV